MKIIYVNGASSSGKTSLCNELQNILHDNYLYIGIDTLISMMPGRVNNLSSTKECEGFYWTEVNLPDAEKGMRVVSGPYGKKVNSAFHEIVKTLLEVGHNLIIDDVADGISEVQIWERELKGHDLTKVGVFCSINELKIREAKRNDRMQGSSTEQFFRVHEGVNYELRVSSDLHTAKKCAQFVADYIAKKEAV